MGKSKLDESKVRKTVVAKAMQSWRALNDVVATFTEDEVLFAMETENERGDENRRPSFVRRLTQRLRQIKIEEALKEMSREQRL